MAKTTFAKATALGILATPNYSRLPALKELATLTTKMTQIANNGISGPLARLLSGHAADPTYRAGYIVTIHTLATAAKEPHLRNVWPTKQTQGPIAVTKNWLKRHGWTCDAPWTWIHSTSRIAFTLSNIALPQAHSDVP